MNEPDEPPNVQELYVLSEANQMGLSAAEFSSALISVGRKFLPPSATYSQTAEFYRKLHIKDFALAQACSRGSPLAWEKFVSRYRDRLYAAALIIAKQDLIARELSEAIIGDLFVGAAKDGEIHLSKMASYSGRGSLEGWLKAVLTHAYVDRYRSSSRVIALDQAFSMIKAVCVSHEVEQQSMDPRLNSAIEEACLRCNSEERFLLRAYFFDDCTLEQIARTLDVHESTASRRLDRILKQLRRHINGILRSEGMSPRQIEESVRAGVWDLSFDLRGKLVGNAQK